ncbi:hypothetical protein GTV32_23085 [Gordonia sp. SID5947]|uniref:restriction endonuclease n=1 Tax=Gordonia sp. SID5947 TaxID=2690315 RepID=UPI001369AF84|nr:restriction endonuclease [Gordonia sp. SID5947]MYR09018.1 hypothetical protein [Gordonia sp. SID5947]
MNWSSSIQAARSKTIYAAAGLLHGMTWQQAERYVCGWMQNTSHYEDAQLTSPGADDGIDIVCDEAIAQVKHHQTAVGIAEVQRMLGIAAALNKQALFFSASGYTRRQPFSPLGTASRATPTPGT